MQRVQQDMDADDMGSWRHEAGAGRANAVDILCCQWAQLHKAQGQLISKFHLDFKAKAFDT